MRPLGSLQPVSLRDVWPDEARDFTPWLAQPENIRQLGAAIGFELEVQHVEAAVGPFSADIVARDVGSGLYVVVENQLNRTDHDHLGKAITYSSALGARTIVWVAPRFTDEHRKALDWLNDNTVDDLGFFGVQVELWAIDGSKPAIRFNVISRPSELVRQAVAQAHGELSPTRQLQLEWWTAFRDALISAKAVTSARSPRGQYWYDVALGRTGFNLSNIANVEDKRIGVRVYLTSRFGATSALKQLLADKDAIEKELGAKLTWDPHPGNMDKVIVLDRQADLNDRTKWSQYLEWLVDATVRVRKVFGPRIKELELETDAEGE